MRDSFPTSVCAAIAGTERGRGRLISGLGRVVESEVSTFRGGQQPSRFVGMIGCDQDLDRPETVERQSMGLAERFPLNECRDVVSCEKAPYLGLLDLSLSCEDDNRILHEVIITCIPDHGALRIPRDHRFDTGLY